VQRVLVAGITGSGKTTYATELARRLDLPFHSMDALFHGPGWQPIPTFVDDVAEVVAGDRWVVDSHGYSAVQDIMWARADTVLWLAYPRRVAAVRVTRRSFHRAWTGEPMFNGNTETFRSWLDPEHPVQWVWTNYDRRRRNLEERFADPRHAEVTKVRFARPATAQRWLDVVAPVPAPKLPPC
jgi:adenylate kinase family enzyme